jgi:hypothetical protein
MIGPNPKIIVLPGGQPEAFADPVVGNAVHSGGGLSICIYGGLPDFTGVLAQEWCEIERERKQGFAAAGVLALIVGGILTLVSAPIVLIAAGIVVALVAGWTLGAGYAPESAEVASHALTALVNQQCDIVDIATAEAWGAASLASYSWIDANRPLLASWQQIRLPVRGPQ